MLGERSPADDITSTWSAGSSNWGNAANWSNTPSTVNFPNNGNGGFTYDSVLNRWWNITRSEHQIRILPDN